MHKKNETSTKRGKLIPHREITRDAKQCNIAKRPYLEAWLYPIIQIAVQAPECKEIGSTGMHIETKPQNLQILSSYYHITTM
uniref:Putative ovule protein n=1 Tax=Solanum chacoense TaxID=4108 RepID=A0A0V0HPW5_SOLCH